MNRNRNRPGAFGAVYALLRVAADVADHWVQSDHQARYKAEPGAEGHKALAGHVGSYVATQAAALVAGNRLLGLGLRPRNIAAALALSGVTHYVIDRRWTVQALAKATHKSNFYDLGTGAHPQHPVTADGTPAAVLGTGAYALDQAAHNLAEGVAAYLAVRD